MFKNLRNFVERPYQGIHVFPGIVKIKAGAVGAGNSRMPHKQLRTVVTGADGDAFFVQYRSHVMRMDIFKGKGTHSAAYPYIARTVLFYQTELIQGADAVFGQIDFMCADIVKTDIFQVADRLGQSDGAPSLRPR